MRLFGLTCKSCGAYIRNGDISGKAAMSDFILKENSNIIQNYQKPVYIAGDFNSKYYEGPVLRFTCDNGFKVLTDMINYPENIDHILECNTNTNRELIESDRPYFCLPNPFINVVSDHYPYLVKVKLK